MASGWGGYQAGEGTTPRGCSRVCQLEPALGDLGRFRSWLGTQVNNLTCWSIKANYSSIGVVLKISDVEDCKYKKLYQSIIYSNPCKTHCVT